MAHRDVAKSAVPHPVLQSLVFGHFPAGRHKKRKSKEERLASVMAHRDVATSAVPHPLLQSLFFLVISLQAATRSARARRSGWPA
jgi:hypothetical protein